MKANNHYIRHLSSHGFLKDLDDILEVARSVSTSIESGNLYGQLVSAFDKALSLFRDLIVYKALDNTMLTRRIKTLQDQDAILLKVICEGLLCPSFQTNHLVFDFIKTVLVTFQCDLCQHRLRS